MNNNNQEHYRPSKRGGVARRGASSPESWNYPDKYYTTNYEIRDLKKEYEQINDKRNERSKEIIIKIKQNEKYIKSIDRSYESFIKRNNKRNN